MTKSKKLTVGQCQHFACVHLGKFIHSVRVFREMSPKDCIREILFYYIANPVKTSDDLVSKIKIGMFSSLLVPEKLAEFLFDKWDMPEPQLTRWWLKFVEGGMMSFEFLNCIAVFISRFEDSISDK